MGSGSRLCRLLRGREVFGKFSPEVPGGPGQPPAGPANPVPSGARNAGREESAALRSKKKNNLVSCLTYRAEEEDEHLERTLEQNKGKMAKKEEKCVLQ